MSGGATFYTIADAGFFPGLAALRPRGRPLLRLVDTVHGSARAAVHALSPVARDPLLDARDWVYRRLGA